MSFVVSYDLDGYPRQHERDFDRVEDAEARANALAEQGIATGISVSSGEEVPAAPAEPSAQITISVEVQLPAEQPEDEQL